MAVHGGFLEIADNHVRVLADTAEKAEEIDIPRAKHALQRAMEEDQNPAEGVDPAAALAAIARAQARIDTADKK
jgi:F-type H+-transporting ATPase subunit epsilon